jgi:serine/threonine protein kinase
VINVYETFVESNFRFIVLEYCPGGSLHDMLSEGPVPMDVLIPYGQQIVGALRACHSHGVAHLDIKPQNILIDKHGRAKLCDFGLALLDRGGFVKQFKGSVAFLAPEVLRHVDYDPFRADVWSLGVTLFVLATGHLPWPETPKEFFAGVVKGLGEVDENLPVGFLGLLRRMIVPEPNDRARLADLEGEFEKAVPLKALGGGKLMQTCRSAPHLGVSLSKMRRETDLFPTARMDDQHQPPFRALRSRNMMRPARDLVRGPPVAKPRVRTPSPHIDMSKSG